MPNSSAPNLPPSPAPWRIGVDVGGTFTDMVLRDAAGAVRIFKAPSVPADPSEGVLGVLRLAAQQLDLPLTRAAARLRAVRARLDRRHQHHPREEGRQGRHADDRGLSRFARDPPRHPREPVGPSRALPRRCWCRATCACRCAGASAPTARSSRRSSPRTSTRRPRCSPTRASSPSPSACSTASSTARTSARPARSSRKALERQVGLAVERGHADHGRVRARLDRRGQRLHRAQGDELSPARSTSSCASSACRARCCCCRATAARSRSTRSRRGR